MAYCLPKHLANDFISKLKSGEINPETLIDMTSKQRREFFSEFLGEENAMQTNALFESKLLLKDQIRGLITWAKQVTGMKPDIKRDIITRTQKMEEVLTPENEDAFYRD